MIIRNATIQDTTEMVALLKQSIGERLTPKTEEYFLWKHAKNPFGKSKMIVAVDNGKIIGLRTFMYWEWKSATEKVTAVRAVDTATDPAFQGKGIFRKLTLQAVDECKAEGTGIVFNSPNPVSMAGYLKMGWSVVGRLPLYVAVGSLLPASYATKKTEKLYSDFSIAEALQKLDKHWSLEKSTPYFHTPLRYDYLSWRYATCPVATYGAIIEPGSFGIIFRVKKMKKFMELRICELWTEVAPGAEKMAQKAIRKLIRHTRPALVSCAASPLFSDKKRPATFFGPFKKGPVITIRPLAKNNLNNFEQFSHWQPSLGSMELF
jgi:GNAT superfamily N-acetyltransferase